MSRHAAKWKPAPCHPERQLYCKGLCVTCYGQARYADPAIRQRMAEQKAKWMLLPGNYEKWCAQRSDYSRRRYQNDPVYREAWKKKCREYQARIRIPWEEKAGAVVDHYLEQLRAKWDEEGI